MLKTKRFLTLVFLCLIFFVSCTHSYKENKVCNQLFKSQIRTAKMFLKATEVRLANAKAKLEVNKKFYDNSKEMEGFKSNPERLKAMRDVLVESQKSHVVWSKVAVKIAKENVNIAKKRGSSFCRNYQELYWI
ncbi:MAG: hypothetical protein LBJ98_01285 [Endomicrobium sp.]|nr:hypothetical protein [Endomicrobium sp.]